MRAILGFGTLARKTQMPLYDYQCSRCSKEFEDLALDSHAQPACPQCSRNDQVARVRVARVTVGKKDVLRIPNIKAVRPPTK